MTAISIPDYPAFTGSFWIIFRSAEISPNFPLLEAFCAHPLYLEKWGRRQITVSASLTICASLQYCGISLRDYFSHPSVHTCAYPLMLDKVIPCPLWTVSWDSSVILDLCCYSVISERFSAILPQPTICLVWNDAAVSTVDDMEGNLFLRTLFSFLNLAEVSLIHPSWPFLWPLVKSSAMLFFSLSQVKVKDILCWLWCLSLLHFTVLEFQLLSNLFFFFLRQKSHVGKKKNPPNHLLFVAYSPCLWEMKLWTKMKEKEKKHQG